MQPNLERQQLSRSSGLSGVSTEHSRGRWRGCWTFNDVADLTLGAGQRVADNAGRWTDVNGGSHCGDLIKRQIQYQETRSILVWR